VRVGQGVRVGSTTRVGWVGQAVRVGSTARVGQAVWVGSTTRVGWVGQGVRVAWGVRVGSFTAGVRVGTLVREQSWASEALVVAQGVRLIAVAVARGVRVGTGV